MHSVALASGLAFDLLDGADAIASYTGLSRARVYYLVANHDLPHTRRGTRIYARKSELDRWFASGAAGSPQPADEGIGK